MGGVRVGKQEELKVWLALEILRALARMGQPNWQDLLRSRVLV